MDIEVYKKQLRESGLAHLKLRIAYMEKIEFDVDKLQRMKTREKEIDKLIKDTYGATIRA